MVLVSWVMVSVLMVTLNYGECIDGDGTMNVLKVMVSDCEIVDDGEP